MSKIRSSAAISASKLSTWILRKLGRGGTNLPGRIAKRIDPNVLRAFSRDLILIVVTGTNGKTTTTRMIEQILKDANIRYFTNKSGANLLTGIIATFAKHCKISGKTDYSHALIECDEAAFRQLSHFLEVDFLVVNNIFRDQLDRYGEITHTLNAIKLGLKQQSNTTLCLNADDSLVASLAQNYEGDILYYGVNCPIYKKATKELSDAKYCPNCHSAYKYKYHTIAHLGSYYCPSCKLARKQPDFALTKIQSSNLDGSHFTLHATGQDFPVQLNLAGAYNIYNALAALTLSHALGLALNESIDSLAHFEVGFGRTETIQLADNKLHLFLVKNPTGFNQTINLLLNLKQKSTLVFLLNDRIADGTDISWIWDVDFESLQQTASQYEHIYLGGIRAYDMALRLKLAGFDPQKLIVVPSLKELITNLANYKGTTFVAPTYTAMFAFRRALKEKVNIKEIYE